MSSITGIEFGPDSCVLARGRRRSDAIELSAGHVIDPANWPAQTAAAAELLKRVRREHNFPRTARVVAWGLAEGAGPRDPATRAALRPLTAAGFRIESVFSPAQALALLAATRPRGAASVWLAINRRAAAIAIVRGADLLYSRAFGWNWEGAAIGSQAQLLQRYSIVAHLAPEVRRGVDLVRSKFGVTVETAVTCGDLPDLRSLTMPLIEELDLEVETLDSAEGLMIPPLARRDHLPDSLAAVRLACAAAAGPLVRGLSVDVVGLARAAAFVAAVGGLAWIGYVWWTKPQPAPTVAVGQTPVPSPRAATVQSSIPQAPPRQRETPPPQPPPVVAVAPEPTVSEPAAPVRADREPDAARTTGTSLRAAAPTPAARETTERPTDYLAPRVNTPQLSARTRVPTADRPRSVQPETASIDTPRAPSRTAVQEATSPPPVPTEPPAQAAAPTMSADQPARGPRPAPLKDPLPVIDTILVSSDRRLAVIDGAFVGVGDTLGARTIVRIEVDAIYFREPSGLEIRVPIRVRREF